jgi:predicted ArsR family transcriptional regulator
MDFLDFIRRGQAAQAAVDRLAVRPGTTVDRVRDALRAVRGWRTTREMAQATGLSVARVNCCMDGLVRRGEAERERSTEDGRRGRGQRYRWKRGTRP